MSCNNCCNAVCYSDSGPVLLPHPEKNPLESWGCALLLCKQRHSTHLGHHGPVVSGTFSFQLCLLLSVMAFLYIVNNTNVCSDLCPRSTMKRTFSSTLPTVMKVSMGAAKGKSDPTLLTTPSPPTTIHLSETSTVHSLKYEIQLSSIGFPQ